MIKREKVREWGGDREIERGGDRDRERPGEKRNPEEKRNARDGDSTADDKGSLVYRARCSSRGNEQKIHGDATCPNLGGQISNLLDDC